MLLFNRYEYQPSADLIGKGNLSRVYKAMDVQLSMPVAVKIYRGGDGAETIGLMDAEKLISIDHPNLCRYLYIDTIEKEGAFGETEKMTVCVQQLMAGGDITAWYKTYRGTTALANIVSGLLRGLACLHDQGIIHRRIKPANLLVNDTPRGPEAKITDFGLETKRASGPDVQFSSVVIGVPHMAPEQFNARKYGIDGKVSANIDFWSLGLTIYEVMTGDVLFKYSPEDSREQVIQHILDPEPPAKIMRLPHPFDKFVSRCLVKNAAERPRGATELLGILDSAMKRDNKRVRPLAGRDMPVRPDADDNGLNLPQPNGPAPDDSPQPQPGTFTPYADIRVLPLQTSTPPVAETTSSPVIESRPALSMRDEQQVTLFNRYEYNPRTGLIGKGGFSRVYKAFDKKLGRWVALKIYKTSDSTDRYSPIAEIRRVINLDHPNICRYLDIEEIEKENAFGENELNQVCVMELLDRGNLLEYYSAHRDEDVLRRLLNDVLDGLAYLHRNDIIHRDIKPANILIRENQDGPVAKITDFGISRLSEGVNNHSTAALVVSIPYMAPEQLNLKKYGVGEKITFNLDLWALGVTLYETITGKILFRNSEQDSSEEIMNNIMAPGVPEKIFELPQPFQNIVRRCVVKDARERVQRAEELIAILNGAPMVEPDPAPVRESRPTPAAKPRRLFPLPSGSSSPVRSARSFVVGDNGHPVTKKDSAPRRNGWIVFLRIAIVSVAGVLAISLYMYTQSRRIRDVALPSKKADSVSIVNQPPPVLNRGAHTLQTHADSTRVASASNATRTADSSHIGRTERKARKSTGETNDNLGGSTAGAAEKYVLRLSADESCTININGTPYGSLQSGQTMRVFLTPGVYIIEATAVANTSSVYRGKLEVNSGMLNQVGDYQITLP
jgi:serine/threonine protein kinase